jgi:beta-phosphoglucomutase
MIRAIVFDFDGVLADSEPLHLRAYQEVLARHGITLTADEYYGQYLGFDDAGMFERLAVVHGIEMDAERIAEFIAEKSEVFDALLGSGDVLYPGAAALVESLAAEFPLGIASGALKHEIRAILRSNDLEDRFRFIVAAGDTRRSKPAPDPYRRAAELHGLVPAQCLAIEDSVWGIQSAKTAGLWCLAVPHTYPAAELSTADLIAPNLAAITPELFQSLGRPSRQV